MTMMIKIEKNFIAFFFFSLKKYFLNKRDVQYFPKRKNLLTTLCVGVCTQLIKREKVLAYNER